MSALSAPASPLLSQSKPSTQSSTSAAEEADTPFASVLQQKVKSGKDDKPAEQAAAPAPAEQAQASTSAEAGDVAATSSPAAALVNGDAAQAALQQLLPWLQAMQQGKDAQSAEDALPVASDGFLPEAIIASPQIAGQPPQLQLDPKAGAAKASAADGAELSLTQLSADEKTASAAANLAAPTEALIGNDKHKAPQESFDVTLQDAHERLDAQTQQSVANGGTVRGETVRLQAPLGTPQWQNELGDRVQFMSRNNESRAELILTPPQLGRIEITLNIDGDQANALFVSANPEVRTALEGAMDRLREALASNGIALGQAHVGAESSNQSGNGDQAGNRNGGQMAASMQDAPAAAWTRHSNNMLDVFA